jgi:hypothetical protein
MDLQYRCACPSRCGAHLALSPNHYRRLMRVEFVIRHDLPWHHPFLCSFGDVRNELPSVLSEFVVFSKNNQIRRPFVKVVHAHRLTAHIDLLIIKNSRPHLISDLKRLKQRSSFLLEDKIRTMLAIKS